MERYRLNEGTSPRERMKYLRKRNVSEARREHKLLVSAAEERSLSMFWLYKKLAFFSLKEVRNFRKLMKLREYENINISSIESYMMDNVMDPVVKTYGVFLSEDVAKKNVQENPASGGCSLP